MRHRLKDGPELTCALTEALQAFRDERMEEINLVGAGIDTEALQNAWDSNTDNFSMSFTYRDTDVFIDRTHIVLTEAKETIAQNYGSVKERGTTD